MNMKHDRPLTGVGAWTVRRRFMTSVAVFLGAIVLACLGAGTVLAALGRLDPHSAGLYGTTIDVALVGLIGINATYVFGAAWQDVSAMRSGVAIGTKYGSAEAEAAQPGEEKS